MPLFTYSCSECNHTQEHMIYPKSSNQLSCPQCGSDRYSKRVSRFKMNVEYADNDEFMENKVQPHVDEAYEKIGREAMKEDTKTLENLFGTDKVEKTIAKHDEA